MDEDKACTWVFRRSREILTITMYDWHSPGYHRMVCFVHIAVYIEHCVVYDSTMYSEHFEIGHNLVDSLIPQLNDRYFY